MDSDDELFKLPEDTSALDSMTQMDDINISFEETNSNSVSDSLRSLESLDDIKPINVPKPLKSPEPINKSNLPKKIEPVPTSAKAPLIDRYNQKFDQLYSKHISKKNPEDVVNHSRKIFNRSIILAQFIVLITLLVVAIINSNVEFISENPGEFIKEATMVGGVTACTAAFIGMSRMASKNDILKSALLVFFIFFVIHVLMEFSGMYGLMRKSKYDISFKETAEREERLKNIQITTAVTGTIVGLIAIAITPIILRVWHFKGKPSKYLFECIVFAVLNAIPAYAIDKNRGADNNSAIVRSVFMGTGFGALYLGLQAGGLINNVFSEPTDLLNNDTHPMLKN
jgi:hypothetical protein